MQFEITQIEEAAGLVHGLVRSNGRDLHRVAEDYFAGPNTSCPYAGGAGDLCPVESWIAKTRGEVPGGDAGDWGLIFHVRDPAGLVAGTHAIEIMKNSTGGIDFRLEDKDMSNSNEIFSEMVENRMAELRSARSDLTEDELREKAVAEILETHPEFASVEKDARTFQRLVDARVNAVRKSSVSPTNERVIRAQATTEVSRERPDLARAVLRKQQLETSLPPKQTVAKAAPQEPLGPAARELDRLVQGRMAEIRKSAGPKDERVLKSMATTEICREHPGLMRQVLNEERHQEARLAFGGVV